MSFPQPKPQPLKTALFTLLKVAVSAAIIAYLVYDATQTEGEENVFANLLAQPKQWGMLFLAWVCCTVAVLLTFVRWWHLVRALDIPCGLSEALGISFWGYLFNLAPLGIVGGDVFKAVMLAHRQPRHRARAVASVLADRVIGLYLLFVVASVGILFSGLWRVADADVRWICKLTFLLTIAGAVVLAIMLAFRLDEEPLQRLCKKIPRLGQPLESLIRAIWLYRGRPVVLMLSSVMSVGVHALFACGCYFIACGLPGNHLSLVQHFVVMPLSSAAGVLPLPMGPFEFVLEYLYTHVPVPGPPIAVGQGLVVALAYRLVTVLIAGLGVFYYFGARREYSQAVQAETAANENQPDVSGM